MLKVQPQSYKGCLDSKNPSIVGQGLKQIFGTIFFETGWISNLDINAVESKHSYYIIIISKRYY